MRSGSGVKVIIVILIIASLTLLGIFGFSPLKLPSIAGMRTGIDIQGGISVTLEAAGELVPSLDELQSARFIIEERLNSQAVYDKNITTDAAGRRIIVEIPYRSDQNQGEFLSAEYDAQRTVVEYIGRTANLTFRPLGSYDGTGDLPEPVLLTGARVTDSRVVNAANGIAVSLKFDAEGTRLFAEATQQYLNRQIAIFMDDEMLAAPTVENVITGGDAVISGTYTLETASRLASQIRSGALPFTLEASELTQITPLLGEGALDITIQAGILAFILIALVMIIIYRLPGFLSIVAFFGLIAAQLVILSVAQITLTLPGIAGIILSIGMGIDANVIIFERLKEELRDGRTLKSAIDGGFRNAFSAILDSNITTLIGSVVLYYLGSGPIKGFAVTLTMGVLLSFVSAITVTRIFLKAASDTKFGKNLKLYGV
ncbi:MAG: protein translocase subunit SecD [Oscillospiraceae bacterium]|nr:protein translocase subunit SecD [Oscillospiraceae bacterium]